MAVASLLFLPLPSWPLPSPPFNNLPSFGSLEVNK
jgi:hypothetical protein